jgi:inosine-uridine nucleoside N-ribohydrolase
MRHLILDVDTGVDDALALCLACLSPGCRVELITTVAGNASADRTTANTLLVLERLGLKDPPPVARGAGRPLTRELFCAPEVHGDDGLGGASRLYPAPKLKPIQEPAWEALTKAVSSRPGELTLVATGPLTNLAKALQERATFLEELESLVVMGGAIQERGNVTEHAEFNIYVDPEAAKLVLESSSPLTLVPLDVTHQAILTRQELASWKREGRKLIEFLEAVADSTMSFHLEVCGFDGLYLHDPLAVAVALDPSLIETRRARLEVDTSEARRGKVKALWADDAPAQVAVDVRAERLLEVFRQVLTGN